MLNVFIKVGTITYTIFFERFQKGSPKGPKSSQTMVTMAGNMKTL